MGSRVNARLEHVFLAFENNCAKVNTDRPILLQLSCRSGNLVSGDVLCGYSQGFSRKGTSNDSGVARHAHVLRLHAEVYSLYA